MRPSNLFFSLVALFVVLFLFCFGAFVLAIPYAPVIQEKIRLGLEQGSGWFLRCGIGILVLATLLLIALVRMYGRRFLLLTMGGKHVVQISDQALVDVIAGSLSQLFPKQEVGCEVLVHGKQRIEILADLPYVCEEEEESVLEKIETSLQQTLAEGVGYTKEFLLSVSFGKALQTEGKSLLPQD